jgi:hypothetical protein
MLLLEGTFLRQLNASCSLRRNALRCHMCAPLSWMDTSRTRFARKRRLPVLVRIFSSPNLYLCRSKTSSVPYSSHKQRQPMRYCWSDNAPSLHIITWVSFCAWHSAQNNQCFSLSVMRLLRSHMCSDWITRCRRHWRGLSGCSWTRESSTQVGKDVWCRRSVLSSRCSRAVPFDFATTISICLCSLRDTVALCSV